MKRKLWRNPWWRALVGIACLGAGFMALTTEPTCEGTPMTAEDTCTGRTYAQMDARQQQIGIVASLVGVGALGSAIATFVSRAGTNQRLAEIGAPAATGPAATPPPAPAPPPTAAPVAEPASSRPPPLEWGPPVR